MDPSDINTLLQNLATKDALYWIIQELYAEMRDWIDFPEPYTRIVTNLIKTDCIEDDSVTQEYLNGLIKFNLGKQTSLVELFAIQLPDEIINAKPVKTTILNTNQIKGAFILNDENIMKIETSEIVNDLRIRLGKLCMMAHMQKSSCEQLISLYGTNDEFKKIPEEDPLLKKYREENARVDEHALGCNGREHVE